MNKKIIKDYSIVNITEKHFEYFCKRCKYWKEKIGLQDWIFVYAVKDLGVSNAFASYVASEVSMKAEITLTNKFEIYSNETLEGRMDYAAFHEVFEIQFCRFRTYLVYFGVSSQLWDEIIHPIINRMYDMVT
jgi:hypothetical protein